MSKVHIVKPKEAGLAHLQAEMGGFTRFLWASTQDDKSQDRQKWKRRKGVGVFDARAATASSLPGGARAHLCQPDPPAILSPGFYFSVRFWAACTFLPHNLKFSLAFLLQLCSSVELLSVLPSPLFF